ncbi:hypothetical protein AOA12_06165 [Microbacterium sp. No. 7]|nr:hypothetical protein AOA12_06165 [Microbacterium sp. No. 7]
MINPLVSLFPSFRRNYYVAKLALIGSEVSEAIEELRHGHAVDETYYPSAPCIDGQGTVVNAFPDEAFKPEGVPSELADVVIRAFDFADEAGIDLASIISEKLTFNATRGQRHGGKEF